MQKRTKIILAIALPIQIIGLQILKQFPNLVEKYYSLGIYPWISKILRYLFGWIPFSVGDIFYVLVTLFALRWIVKNFKRIKTETVNFFLDLLAVFSIVYFAFHFLWGFNYYRLPLHQSLGIENEYNYEQLISTTEVFITKSNQLHRQLNGDTLMIPLPYSQKEFMDKTKNGYNRLKQEFPKLSYTPKSLKKSISGLGITYMGYGGYLNPFSGEAQVNGLIESYYFPVVACHEEAHQIGYAAENEANFIAVMATLKNDDLYFQYAGSIFTLRYLLNEVARSNREKFDELITTVNPGILASYRELSEFWEKYDNPFEELSKVFWDNFLKANNQSQGIQSYNYMVALVINYFQENSL